MSTDKTSLRKGVIIMICKIKPIINKKHEE